MNKREKLSLEIFDLKEQRKSLSKGIKEEQFDDKIKLMELNHKQLGYLLQSKLDEYNDVCQLNIKHFSNATKNLCEIKAKKLGILPSEYYRRVITKSVEK